MAETNKYSLALIPRSEIVEQIRVLKKSLEKEIGWYSSVNAGAHITVIEFKDDQELETALPKIRKFASAQQPFEAHFDSFDHFGEWTFFIAPDTTTRKSIDKLIRDFWRQLGLSAMKVHAHMSIGRKLGPEKMEITKAFFSDTKINFTFPCDALFLREFNETTKQYSKIISTFKFEGKPEPDLFNNLFS